MILLPAIIGGAILAIIGYVASTRERDMKRQEQQRRSTDRPRAVASR